jgi:hypothetical protein
MKKSVVVIAALSLAFASGGAMAQSQLASTSASCASLHKAASAFCDSDKMNVSSRDHCHMHVDQELGFCKSSGKWNLSSRWGGAGQMSGLARQ